MAYYKGPMERADGTPLIPAGEPHNCYYPSGWNRPYSHTTVATILHGRGSIAATIARHPDEPAEGGKLALPGGYVETGQTLRDPARTEVLEETGHLIIAGTLGRFAILDGPSSLPGRHHEENHNIVHVYTAEAGLKVQEHDEEVTDVVWIDRGNMPPFESFAFGHFDIIHMWFRHNRHPFTNLPIEPSAMTPKQLFLPEYFEH
jgi:ADP-ribose pyrophosphatase YjhB (NUDIX family)